MPNLIIPSKFLSILDQNQKLKSSVETSISNFKDWIDDNKLIFFPEYTDHGINHLQEVLDSAQGLISDSSWSSITPEDIAAIVLSILLHDCALHLSEDGFYELINDEYPKIDSRYVDIQESWKILWSKFLEEAKRFDDNKLILLFGKKVIVSEIPSDKGELTRNHRLLIGEFLRRHHARLAHEIAFNGIPNGIYSSEKIKLSSNLSPRFYDLIGFIAKSHNLSLRKAVDCLGKNSKQSDQNIHVPFVMAILRIADYIQIHSDRAPADLLKVKKLMSPISRGEWSKHHAIDQINNNHDDPEAIYIDAEPSDAITYESLERLFADIQKELDLSWSIIGEIYGRYDKLKFGLTIRRVRSSLDNKNEFIKEKKINYIPEVFRFRTAHTQLMELLIKPLYGNRPEVGIRELLQNSIDAVKERKYLADKGTIINNISKEFKVTLILEEDNERYFFIIKDDGIGMSKEVIRDYFLNVGASFRHSDIWKENYTHDGKANISRIGRFGVGVLAAYLLGNKISVKTRSVFEAKGLSFECENIHAPIQIYEESMDIGTTITIELDNLIYNYLLQHDWQWYYLEEIYVERIYIKNKEAYIFKKKFEIEDSSFSILKNNSSFNVKFNFLKYSDIKYKNNFDPMLLCNGILIKDYGRYERNLKLNKEEDFLKLNIPSLLVEDPEGKFPLDLQRDRLVGNPDFIMDLRNQIYRNILKKESVEKIRQAKEIEKIECCNITPYLYGEHKKYLFDFSIMKSLNHRKLIYFIIDQENNNNFSFNMKDICNEDFVYTIFSVDKTKSVNIDFLRSVFLNRDYTYYGLHFNRISEKSKQIFLILKKEDIGKYVGKGHYPPTFWDLLFKENINEQWIVVSNKEFSDDINHIKFKNIAQYLDQESIKYLLAYDFDWDEKPMELTDFAKVYQEQYPDFNLI